MFDDSKLQAAALAAAVLTGCDTEGADLKALNAPANQIIESELSLGEIVPISNFDEIEERTQDYLTSLNPSRELAGKLELLAKNGYELKVIEAKSLALEFHKDGIRCASPIGIAFGLDQLESYANDLQPVPISEAGDFLTKDSVFTPQVEARVLPLLQEAAAQGLRLEIPEAKSGIGYITRVDSRGEKDPSFDSISLFVGGLVGYRAQDNIVHAVLKECRFNERSLYSAVDLGLDDIYQDLGRNQSVILRDNLSFKELSWRGISFTPGQAGENPTLQIKGFGEAKVEPETSYIEAFRGPDDGSIILYVHNRPTAEQLRRNQCTLQRVEISPGGKIEDTWNGERTFGAKDPNFGYYPPKPSGIDMIEHGSR